MKGAKKIVLFTLFAMNLVDQPAPEVTIEQGKVSGKISADGTFFEYLGIPYATSNISSRFKDPLPPPTWSGTLKAVEIGPSCPQQVPKLGVVGEEDCLKMNIYVPAFATKPLAVLVWIHGGAFIVGSASKLMYSGEFLVKRDVIVVTFNYRLGALGFICLGIEEAPGNAGLRDQIAALKWVKKNIAAFGGDPDNVTLFGESAGGTSTSHLLASNATEGLFHKAIIQSGSAISNWAINRQPLYSASLMAEVLGFKTSDPHELYNIFSKMPYEELIAIKALKPLNKFFDSQLFSLPCVEKKIPGVEPVIPDLPYNLITKSTKNIPLIYGSTSKEGWFLVGLNASEIESRNGRYLFASDIVFESEQEEIQMAQKLQEFYYGKKLMTKENIENMTNLYTHNYFEMPAILESEVFVDKNTAPIYHYYFNYNGDRNFLKHRYGFGKEDGASHGDDLLYLFHGNIWPYSISKQDQKMIYWMTKIWTDFAKYSDPTPPTSDVPVKWIPSTKEKLNFLYIEDQLKMGPLPNPEAYKLWKDIYKYRRRTPME